MLYVAKKGIMMETCRKSGSHKNRLSQSMFFFAMLLFAVCLTVNVLFCGHYHLYGLMDRAAAAEAWAGSESIAADGGHVDAADPGPSFWDGEDSTAGTIRQNVYPLSMIAALPDGFRLVLFPALALCFYFLAFFLLLPDGWTLIGQKVRLDN